ncbi:MAG: DUF1294 domain-containing protein [Clostridia bacterium]|nr:DUF1294 domain-containing protein [Clostridia bacterium]
MELSIVWMVLWMVAVSIVATLITMWDKNRARRREFRISESTLWMLAAVGGATAMWTTMYVIRHKTRHRRFMIGLPLLAVIQLGTLVLLWKLGFLVTASG